MVGEPGSEGADGVGEKGGKGSRTVLLEDSGFGEEGVLRGERGEEGIEAATRRGKRRGEGQWEKRREPMGVEI